MHARLAGLLLLLPQLAASAVDDPTELAPVIVTATRTPQTAGNTLASVSVVTRAELERRQVRTVAGALAGLPGVVLTNSGGAGQPTSLLLRGTEFDQVLVLIDGVRVGSATLGAAAFQDLPIEEIDRIEVVRGPRSSLYGSEAIGGVIQIFTRKGGGDLAPRLSLGTGSYNTVAASLGVSGGGARGWFDASIGFEQTDGFNACSGEPFVAGCFTIEPDRDGHGKQFGSARAGYRFDDLGSLDLHWLRSESSTEFDGTLFGGNESEGVQEVMGAKVSIAPGEGWDIDLAVGRSLDVLDIYYQGAFLDTFETQRDSLSWQNDIAIGEEHLLTAGVDYLEDRVGGTVDYTANSRSSTGVFGQYQGRFGANLIKASLRRDDNEQFGGHTSGDTAWGYGFDSGVRVSLSYGTAFKAPTFNDLYYPYFGNPDLDPETSRSLELGLSGDYSVGNWSVSLYQTDIDNLIAFDAVVQIPRNIDSARIRGLEAAGTARLAAWDLNAALTLLDPVNQSEGANAGNLLPRRPQQSFRLDADRELGDYSLGASLLATGRSYDDLANRIRLDGYVLVDLRAEYRFTDDLRLQGRIENLFDADYETAAYYNQAGRGFYLTLRYTP